MQEMAILNLNKSFFLKKNKAALFEIIDKHRFYYFSEHIWLYTRALYHHWRGAPF